MSGAVGMDKEGRQAAGGSVQGWTDISMALGRKVETGIRRREDCL
ncbi:hypothetical protein [Porcincola intestinalis]|nr:hypothetical protein [Porcincola intestinalis]MDD7061123.1 hypothetical protein [Porcincola intestinalis]MDY4205575.1 hypothetical protein [Porcincola intestinalis]MDY5283475.1 hypothetical protein [Porcincola intestinalis]